MNTGRIVQVVGPVVDVAFPERLPRIYNALSVQYQAQDGPVNSLDDSDEWEELPVLLQSGDVSDLIWAARQRGLSASILAGSILREFLHSFKNYACERRLPGSQP